jgi:hypothetical protein
MLRLDCTYTLYVARCSACLHNVIKVKEGWLVLIPVYGYDVEIDVVTRMRNEDSRRGTAGRGLILSRRVPSRQLTAGRLGMVSVKEP